MSIGANDVCIAVQPLREGTGGFFRRFAQAQTAQVRQGQRALTAHVGFTASTNLGNVAQSIGTLIAKFRRIFTCANTE
ncbi:hypothetical protein D3C78_1122990 [compost metagenome]